MKRHFAKCFKNVGFLMLNKYFKLQRSALNNFVNHKTPVTLMLLSVCLKGDLELTFLIFFIYLLHYFYIVMLLINEERTPTELFIVAETRELSHLSF